MPTITENQTIRPQRAGTIFQLIIFFLLLSLVPGCDNSAPSSADALDTAPIKARLADAFLQGVDYAGLQIEADDFDPITQILTGIRVTTPQSLLSAARAEININYADQTAQLILYDVVTAGAPTATDAAAEDNPDLEGPLITYERLELEPFSIKQ